MTLTDIEKKFLMLAMDNAAEEFEMAVAATKLIRAFRKRFPSGVELIKAIESGLEAPRPGEVVFRTHQEAAAAASAMSRGFGSGWNDIMREAQRMGQARAAAQSQQRKAAWEDYCRTHGNPFKEEL